MDMELARRDAYARVHGVNLDGSPRRQCIAEYPVPLPDRTLYGTGPACSEGAPGARGTCPVLQDWVMRLPFMQQTVLLTAIRGPDHIKKFHPVKPLLRWYRRSVLISAFEGIPILTPFTPGGGSFTGSVYTPDEAVERMGGGQKHVFAGADEFNTAGFIDYMNRHWERFLVPAVDAFLEARDELPHHFIMHAIHAFQILGYKHVDLRVRAFWEGVYVRNVHACHLWPESEVQMDHRLGDNKAAWQARADQSETRGCSVTCSD